MDYGRVASVEARLRLAQVIRCTEAEGPGRRFAVWVQGCPLRCPGCCNPEMLPFEGGWEAEVDALAGRVGRAAEVEGVEGITLLGGEPLAQAAGSAALARRVQAMGLTVMVFSGFTLAEIRALGRPGRPGPARPHRPARRRPLPSRPARAQSPVDRVEQPAGPRPYRPLPDRRPPLVAPEHAGAEARRRRLDGQRLPCVAGRRALASAHRAATPRIIMR